MQLIPKLFARISITCLNTKNQADLLKKVAILKLKIVALNVNCKPGIHLFLTGIPRYGTECSMDTFPNVTRRARDARAHGIAVTEMGWE